MASIVKQVSARAVIVSAQHNGLILSFGPASTSSSVGTFIMQFNPDVDSDLQATVMGRCWGQFSKDQDVPFMPIPYRIASLNNVARDYAIVSTPISGPALIQIPANWEIGLFVAMTVGTCAVCSWNLPGPSTP